MSTPQRASSAPSPGHSAPGAPSPPSPQPPTIPDHQLLRSIGGGSYGEVWLARSVMGTYRAVKIVHRHTFDHDRPFEREFAGIQKFEPISRSHEGLVDLLQVGRNEQEGYFYYVMELADDANAERGTRSAESAEGTPAITPQSALRTPQSYEPRTLRSFLRPNPQPSTINSQPTAHLPLDECMQLGLSLTEALNYLHNQGLVHRDIKPSNIIFVGGVPKLADVGLVTGVDEARSYVGTEGFMPPEGPGTPQADLYSLGILLYQMSTGKSHQDFPEPLPDLAAQPDHDRWLEFNAVVHKACCADVRARYQSAGEMHAELALLQRGESVKRRRTLERRRDFAKKYGLAAAAAALVLAGVWLLASRFEFVKIHRSGTASSPSSAPVANTFIAVLPFDNDSPDKGEEYLGGQMAEELSAALGKIPELRVLGQNSAVRLKDTNDLRTAARQLKLDAVLSGRLHKSDGQLHVSAQLIRPADDSQLWSEVYDREVKEIFGIQTDIAEKLAEKLKLKLTDTVRASLATKTTKNFEAYRCYMEGRDFWNRYAFVEAFASFQQASQLDTNFALAYAGLSDVHSVAVAEQVLRLSLEVNRSNALALAEKAVRLDDRSAEAHTSLAMARYQLYDWTGSEKEYQRAINLNPNYSHHHRIYAKLLSALGRFDEAIAESQMAKELDPWSPSIRGSLGWTLFDARRYDQAQKEFEELLKLDEKVGRPWDGLGWCYEVMGKHDDAIAAWEKDQQLWGEAPEKIAELAQAYKSGGMRGYRQKDLDQMLEQAKQGGHADSYWIAADYAAIEDKDQAFQWLDRAYKERHPEMPLIAVEYRLNSLHADSRFADLLKKMGLPSLPLATNTPSQVKSIAVLPFDNENPDKADAHLGASTADAISSALTKIPGLKVLGRDSGIALKNAKDLRATAGSLDLQAVLSGSVHKSGNQLHLTAQLKRQADDSLLWSEVYDRPWSEVFGIQSDIAEKVAESLTVMLTDTTRTRLALKATKNFEAYQFYLEGHDFLNRGMVTNAIASFQSAVGVDTSFAAAYAGLASCYIQQAHEDVAGTESFPKALDHAKKAVQLANELPEAHAALARVKCHFEYDWKGAEEEFRLAIKLGPSSPKARQYYSEYLDITGRFDEAVAQARVAKELDPLSLGIRITLAWNLFDARRYDEALAEFRSVLELQAKSGAALDGVGWYQYVKGSHSEAIAMWENCWGDMRPEDSAKLIQAYRDAGMHGYWLEHVKQSKEGAQPSNKSPFWIACDYAMLGEYDQAFAWLERAYEDRTYYMPWVTVEYRLSGLHSDPRFAALLGKMGLSMPVWKE